MDPILRRNNGPRALVVETSGFGNMRQSNNITTPWLLDSSTSHHLTSDNVVLEDATPYTCNEQVTVGNVSTLPILSIGNACMIQLSDILHTPSKIVEFHTNEFFIKDAQEGGLLLKARPVMNFTELVVLYK